MEIKVTALDEQRVVDFVAEKVLAATKERIDEAVRGAIKGALDETLRTLVEEALRPAVAAVLAEGWQRTNTYGEAVGPKMDLKARVSEMLHARDGYNGQSFIQKTAQEILDKALREELGKQIEEAKKAFRAQVDGVLQAKFKEALAGALGLRT